jgi:hypothetical protein
MSRRNKRGNSRKRKMGRKSRECMKGGEKIRLESQGEEEKRRIEGGEEEYALVEEKGVGRRRKSRRR